MPRWRERGSVLMQQYLFGDLQLGVEDGKIPDDDFVPDLIPAVYELMHNEPILRRGRRYKLLDGRVIEINGILSSPSPENRRAPGPSWDHSYWLDNKGGPPIPERELLDRLESTKFALGGATAPKPKKRKKRRS